MIRWESGGWWAYRGGIWVGFRCSATARDSTIERRSMGRARTTSTTSEAVLATSIPGDPLIVADLRVSTDGLQSTRPRLTKNDVRPDAPQSTSAQPMYCRSVSRLGAGRSECEIEPSSQVVNWRKGLARRLNFAVELLGDQHSFQTRKRRNGGGTRPASEHEGGFQGG